MFAKLWINKSHLRLGSDWLSTRIPYFIQYSCLQKQYLFQTFLFLNPLNAELNPICYLLALLANPFSPR